jgi:hypothetical protein
MSKEENVFKDCRQDCSCCDHNYSHSISPLGMEWNCLNPNNPENKKVNLKIKIMKTINPLHDFFNSKSDANEFLDSGQQERLEQEFEIWFNARILEDFDYVSNMMINHMARRYHPHMTCLVDQGRAELLEGKRCNRNPNFIVD